MTTSHDTRGSLISRLLSAVIALVLVGMVYLGLRVYRTAEAQSCLEEFQTDANADPISQLRVAALVDVTSNSEDFAELVGRSVSKWIGDLSADAATGGYSNGDNDLHLELAVLLFSGNERTDLTEAGCSGDRIDIKLSGGSDDYSSSQRRELFDQVTSLVSLSVQRSDVSQRGSVVPILEYLDGSEATHALIYSDMLGNDDSCLSFDRPGSLLQVGEEVFEHWITSCKELGVLPLTGLDTLLIEGPGSSGRGDRGDRRMPRLLAEMVCEASNVACVVGSAS